MGIKGLKRYLEENAPEGFGHYFLHGFAGKKMAIDISGLMYKYMSVSRNRVIDSTNLMMSELDQQKIFDNWIKMLLDNVKLFLENDITPVYVFDGRPLGDKNEEIQRRNEARRTKQQEVEHIKQEIKEIPTALDSIETIQKFTETDSELTKKMKQIIKI